MNRRINFKEQGFQVQKHPGQCSIHKVHEVWREAVGFQVITFK